MSKDTEDNTTPIGPKVVPITSDDTEPTEVDALKKQLIEDMAEVLE